jgi:hypothetical protein
MTIESNASPFKWNIPQEVFCIKHHIPCYSYSIVRVPRVNKKNHFFIYFCFVSDEFMCYICNRTSSHPHNILEHTMKNHAGPDNFSMCLYNWFVIESHDNYKCMFLSYFKKRWHEHFSNMLFEVNFMEQYIFFLIRFHHGFDIDIVTVDRGEWHILQIVLYMIKLLLFIIIFQRYSNIVNMVKIRWNTIENKIWIKKNVLIHYMVMNLL